MEMEQIIKAALRGEWYKPNPDVSSGFRLHFDNLPENLDLLNFNLLLIGRQLGIKNMHKRVSAAGSSSKFKGASVVAFDASPFENSASESSFEELEFFLQRHGVLCVEAGDAVFFPRQNMQYPTQNLARLNFYRD